MTDGNSALSLPAPATRPLRRQRVRNSAPLPIKRYLKPRDLTVLKWFLTVCRFSTTARERLGSDWYYAVNYKSLATHLKISEVSANRSMRKLAGHVRNQVHGQDHIIQIRGVLKLEQTWGWHTDHATYYAVDKEVMRMLATSFPELSKEVARPISTRNKAQAKPIEAPVIELLETAHRIKSLHDEGKPEAKLFHGVLPDDSHHYTKSMGRSAAVLTSLYTGHWRNVLVLSDQARDRFQAKIGPNVEKALDAVKGDWKAVTHLILASIRNYRTWFDPKMAPTSKAWLPRNFSDWLYSAYSMGGSSLFMACVIEGAQSSSEDQADEIYNALPEKVAEWAVKYEPQAGPAVVYWLKVAEMYDWFVEWRLKLVDKFSSLRAFVGNGVLDFFTEYGAWLKNGPSQCVMGLRCSAWIAYLHYQAQRLDVPLRVLMSPELYLHRYLDLRPAPKVETEKTYDRADVDWGKDRVDDDWDNHAYERENFRDDIRLEY